MDLIFERAESNVARGGLASETEGHALSTARPTVLVTPLIEAAQTQLFIVNDD